MTAFRSLQAPLPAREATDGDGVRILRSLGPRGMGSLDPFLMLDELRAEGREAAGGFPPHPHRGFETVTYMLEGGFRHEDHMGNQGEVGAGGVQWMTAGRGVIHSEMPLPEQARLHGFQLWLNLPAGEKMRAPGWWDIPARQVPRVGLPGGGEVRVIAGTPEIAGRRIAAGAPARSTDPHYLDVRLPPGGELALSLPASHSGFVYVHDGALLREGGVVPAHALSQLGPGDTVRLQAGGQGVGVLLLYARPLREPLQHYGPFVMNTAAEIEQAVRDYRAGTLTG